MCKVEGCISNTIRANGYCSRHYYQINKYGKILDKCNYIFLSGGGSTFFKTTEDGFIRVPKTKVEFYNSIGFGLFGLTKIQGGN